MNIREVREIHATIQIGLFLGLLIAGAAAYLIFTLPANIDRLERQGTDHCLAAGYMPDCTTRIE